MTRSDTHLVRASGRNPGAGRNLSFKTAAEELHVSPSAVGHLVSVLETYFGARLFYRIGRTVSLTRDGEALLPGLSEAFRCLETTVTNFHKRDSGLPLVVSVEPAFGRN